MFDLVAEEDDQLMIAVNINSRTCSNPDMHTYAIYRPLGMWTLNDDEELKFHPIDKSWIDEVNDIKILRRTLRKQMKNKNDNIVSKVTVKQFLETYAP